MPAVAWYEEWFGQEYLDLYAHRDDDEAELHVAFVERVFGTAAAGDAPGNLGRPTAVLDLACGAGRHTAALRRRGLRALGVDLSVTLLAQDRTDEAHWPRAAGDMRQLPFAAESFGWVLNFFTSFGYFETERENFRVLEEIVRVLEPGGRFLIDLMNIDSTLAHLRPKETQQQENQTVDIERWWDGRTSRLHKRIRLSSPGRPTRTFVESVRGYRADEVTIGLRWSGLEVEEVFGDFDGSRHEPTSARLILVGSKRS
jgi:SAM-dependent methyltransferase